MLLKRVKRGEAKLRRGEWAQREDRGDFLFGKTVGIVGLGRIGTHVARRLARLGRAPARRRSLRRRPSGPRRSASRWWTCRRCSPSPTS